MDIILTIDIKKYIYNFEYQYKNIDIIPSINMKNIVIFVNIMIKIWIYF